MNLAPIVLFVYNRPWHTQQTIETLQKNELAKESELFIYSDASSNDRLHLTIYWFSLLVENPFALFFGFDQTYLDGILYNRINIPHNSYIVKIMNGGMFSLFAFLWLLFRRHSNWVIIYIALYGFLLHGLFSVPLLIILQIFSQYNYKKNNCNNT